MNEKENTLRTLADQPLLVKRWQCIFGIHQWEQWSSPYVPKGQYLMYQQRFCNSCKKFHVKRITSEL